MRLRLIPLWCFVSLLVASIDARHPDPGAAGDRQERPPLAPTFHHVHLVPGDPVAFAEYYARLFRPGRVERGEFHGHQGVRDATAMLLFSPSETPRNGESSVVWQMGWGKVSLDHTYRQHYAQEVDWAPPYPSLSAELHLHIRCRDASEAAQWYRDVLGAAVDISSQAAVAANSESRAIVRFEGLTLLLHPTPGRISPSREAGQIDHIAFSVQSLADVAETAVAQGPLAPYRLRARRSALLEGPDGLLIELVEEQ